MAALVIIVATRGRLDLPAPSAEVMTIAPACSMP
jgi:hypothetical protein